MEIRERSSAPLTSQLTNQVQKPTKPAQPLRDTQTPHHRGLSVRQTAKPLEIKTKMREVGCNSNIMCQKVAPLQQQKKHNRIQATVFRRQPTVPACQGRSLHGRGQSQLNIMEYLGVNFGQRIGPGGALPFSREIVLEY